MEELVGKQWHHWITRLADPHRHAAVELSTQHYSLTLLLRALSGQSEVVIRPALKRVNRQQRSWLQRLAGNRTFTTPAWRDADTLYLPTTLALFDDSRLNREHYLWLTALGSLNSSREALLQRYPALQPRWQRLIQAWQRLYGEQPPLPLQLAIAERSPPPSPTPEDPAALADNSPPEDEGNHSQQSPQRHRAERAELPQQRGSMLAFRLESLFSWTEFLPLNRAHDESPNPDAARTAEDMEQLHLQRSRSRLSHRIRLDFDLPATEYDDLPLGDGIPLPEWDYRHQQLRANYCKLQIVTAREESSAPLPSRLHPLARQLRKQMAVVETLPQWRNRQEEGSEIDIEEYIDYQSQPQRLTLPAIYRQPHPRQRQIATLLLADLSLSTDSCANNNTRVIDIIQDALLLFGETLHHLGDSFALYGFSSIHRQQVRYNHLKAFNERYDDRVRGRILATKPGYYTRMGAAIRYATKQLQSQIAEERLLLLLTDGKPNDLDHYEGRYGLEDTRHAIVEAKRQGVRPFCITIDQRAEAYLPHLFGQQGWVWVRQVEDLPKKLSQWYGNLTRRH